MIKPKIVFVEGVHYHILSNGCWEWLRSKDRDGYGRIVLPSGKTTGAHRYSYQNNVGEISSTEYVLHKCDNPSCINPDHLFKGSQLDNMRDMRTKKPHYAAKLTEADVIRIRELAATDLKHREIAAMFGLARNTITNIVNRKRWDHV